jgi:hypothetical protein
MGVIACYSLQVRSRRPPLERNSGRPFWKQSQIFDLDIAAVEAELAASVPPAVVPKTLLASLPAPTQSIHFLDRLYR